MLFDNVYHDDQEILNENERELHEMARLGDLDMVKELIRNRVNVNALDEKLRSALHLAAGQGHDEVIKELLTAGASINHGDIYGMNAFLWAAWFGKTDTMKELIQKGADNGVVNKQGLSVIHCAATRGHVEVLTYLVKEVFKEDGFDDEDGLFGSVAGKMSNLLGSGVGMLASLGRKKDDEDGSSSTFGGEKLRPETSKYEAKAGKAGDDSRDKQLLSPQEDNIIGTGMGIVKGELKNTATYTAEVGQRVIELIWGRDPEPRNDRPIKKDVRPDESYFELRTVDEQQSRILDQTREEQAKNNLAIYKRGKKTAFHLAAEQGHLEAVEYLIKAKCNRFALTGDGSTAVHLAAGTGRTEIVTKLLEQKLQINALNTDGLTALHIAAEAGEAEMVDFLLTMKADVNITAAKEVAALHMAAKKNHTQVIDVIGKYDFDVNVTCEGGNTALHLAAALGHLEAVQALVANGAEINSVNEKNQTALHEVTENGFTDIVEFLLVAGAKVHIADKNNKTALLLAIRAENITITDMIIKAERFYEGIRQNRIDRKTKVTSFRNERTPQQKQMKPFLYDLAMKELEEDDLKRLFFHWKFKELHMEAIQVQYVGNKSWREHAYRMLLIWLHGCDENPLKVLYETLVTAGRKKLADKLRKKANNMARGK